MPNGFSGQLAGGTHHAHADFGSGFCALNDFALAAVTAIAEGIAVRVTIVDLDVHQGDSNASIFRANPAVLVFSLHAEKTFPFRTRLRYRAAGRHWRRRLTSPPSRGAGRPCWASGPIWCCINLALIPLLHDGLSRLSLSYDGLAARDRLVFETFAAQGIAVSFGVGGGYCDPIEQTVAAYVNTVVMAKAIHRL